jgi:hypothetical protein
MPVKVSDNTDDIRGPKLGAYQSAEGDITKPKMSGSVQRRVAGIEIISAKSESSGVHADVVMPGCSQGAFENVSAMGDDVQQQQRGSNLVQKDSIKLGWQSGGNKVSTVSSHISQNIASADTRTSSAIRGTGTHTYMSFPPPRSKSSTGISTYRGESSSIGKQRIKVGHISDQQRMFSAKGKIVAERAAVSEHRPRNRGSKIMYVARGVKPKPQWCPAGLTHTQKRRVQRLRASEIKEEIVENKRTECFNRDGPIIPLKMTWKEKHITTDENRNMDDTVVAQNSENNIDASTDMDVDQGG